MTRMIIGRDTGSLINHVMSGDQNDIPVVGMGATVLSWTDRHAGTIIETSENRFVVQRDKSILSEKDSIFGPQNYTYEPDPEGNTWTFKRVSRGRAKGTWREGGRIDGLGVLINHRESYSDPSF